VRFLYNGFSDIALFFCVSLFQDGTGNTKFKPSKIMEGFFIE